MISTPTWGRVLSPTLGPTLPPQVRDTLSAHYQQTSPLACDHSIKAPSKSPIDASPLTGFDPLVAEWFTTRFAAATEPQIQGWPEIRAGHDVLISAPTGSGKTLSAFLICLDELVRAARAGELVNETEVVYVSPLKALSTDVPKNLEIPLAEISELAARRGIPFTPIRTAVRTGDTPASERTQMGKTPPHILVTTPESLYILL